MYYTFFNVSVKFNVSGEIIRKRGRARVMVMPSRTLSALAEI